MHERFRRRVIPSIKMVKPNNWDCESCPHWDEVNGCWRDCKFVCEEGLLDEDGLFIDEEEEKWPDG